VWYLDKEDPDRALELLTQSSEITGIRNRTRYAYNLACDYFDIGLVFTDKDDPERPGNFTPRARLYSRSLN